MRLQLSERIMEELYYALNSLKQMLGGFSACTECKTLMTFRLYLTWITLLITIGICHLNVHQNMYLILSRATCRIKSYKKNPCTGMAFSV